MSTISKILVGCAVLALPVVASAQSNDAGYCYALSKTYRDTVSRLQSPTPEVPVAMSKCGTAGNADAVSTLERALTDARVALPRHS
jgi:hypothetical protein